MALPHLNHGVNWLTWVGFETDLIFNRGIDLPHFSSYPLLDSDEGRAHVRRAYRDLVDVAAANRCGTILESMTWMANADRARPLGYGPDDLARVNRAAIEIMSDIACDTPLCFSAQIGPRADAYAAGEMDPRDARDYHMTQIEILADTKADLFSAYTLASVDEAAGIARAVAEIGRPLCIAFTVETDGRLPDGTRLADAIDTVDQDTGGSVAFFVVNCAHPEHLAPALDDSPPLVRLGGVVVNASRMSHAELDKADVLDDGNPAELGVQIGALSKALPQMRVFGGCCGTDMRHMREIALAVAG